MHKDSKIVLLEQSEILYFESVDDIVFAYTKDDVFETKSKLYQLEQELPGNTFFRASKAVILNIDKIDSLSPAFGGRFEAVLENGYKVNEQATSKAKRKSAKINRDKNF